jgi:hypothetical protein
VSSALRRDRSALIDFLFGSILFVGACHQCPRFEVMFEASEGTLSASNVAERIETTSTLLEPTSIAVRRRAVSTVLQQASLLWMLQFAVLMLQLS